MFHLRNASFRNATLAAAVTALTALPTAAATQDGQFAVRGLGAHLCSDVIAALSAPDNGAVSAQLASWVAGYLSHANRTTSGNFDVMPIQDIYDVSTIIARVCENNPERLLEEVSASVLELMAPAAQTEASELITIQRNDRSVTIRESVLVMAQQRMITRGLLLEGSADGQYGPNTRNALLQFQQGSGLNQTGLPDSMTLFLLLAPR